MTGRGRLRAAVRRPPTPRRFGSRPRRRSGRWFGTAFLGIGLLLGATLLAPVADDVRSRLRATEAGCRIDRVIDGDTVDLGCPGRAAVRARIVGFDAPELSSPACAAEAQAGERARAHLAALLAGAGSLEVAFLGRDRYDRALVDIRAGGVRVASAMVAAGQGRRYLGGLRRGWCA